jgi:hypothetical protein
VHCSRAFRSSVPSESAVLPGRCSGTRSGRIRPHSTKGNGGPAPVRATSQCRPAGNLPAGRREASRWGRSEVRGAAIRDPEPAVSPAHRGRPRIDSEPMAR